MKYTPGEGRRGDSIASEPVCQLTFQNRIPHEVAGPLWRKKSKESEHRVDAQSHPENCSHTGHQHRKPRPGTILLQKETIKTFAS